MTPNSDAHIFAVSWLKDRFKLKESLSQNFGPDSIQHLFKEYERGMKEVGIPTVIASEFFRLWSDIFPDSWDLATLQERNRG